MSLDIALYDSEGNVITEMNWLRNPFGLCQWAEDNAHYLWQAEPATNDQLWFVCNTWNYAKSEEVDRAHFKSVVDRYWDTLKGLEVTYYFFNLPAYRQFVESKIDHLPTNQLAFTDTLSIEGSKYDKEHRLMIPVDLFKPSIFNLGNPSTEKQKQWMMELVDFADKLQDETCRFYCSN